MAKYPPRQEMQSITNNPEGHQWCGPLGCTVQQGTAWNGILHISAEQQLSLPSLPFTSSSQPKQGGEKTSQFWRLWVYLVGRAGFPGSSAGKESTCNAGDSGLIHGMGRSPGGGHGNPLKYCCWRIPWTEEPGELQSIGLQRVGNGLVTKQQ